MTEKRHPGTVEFTEDNISKLFGHEAAEDESPGRLRKYYFKAKAYDQMATDLPLRILVGHKGIGKSALFKVAIAEEHDKKRLPILIQPNDIADLTANSPDFLQNIRQWTLGLNEIIAKKVLSSFGLGDEKLADFKNGSGRLLNFSLTHLRDIRGSRVSVKDQQNKRFWLSFSDPTRFPYSSMIWIADGRVGPKM